ncbi:MAG TPA: FlgO family outer membrane protein, partial [Armatimonadota bacterium]|nr:FlgO family outer membrane protein [Armatimonadota bacterium]
MNSPYVSRLVMAALAVLLLAVQAPLFAQKMEFGRGVVAGRIAYRDRTVSVGGNVYDNYLSEDVCYGNTFVTFDIRGYDHFTAYVGINDDRGGGNDVQRTTIETDGDVFWQQDVARGQKAVFVDVPLTGKRSLTLRWKSSSTVFADPRLIKGNPVAQAANTTNSSRPTQAVAPSSASASFVVDPNDLDKLSENLRKRVDAKPEIQGKLARGYMAVMTFSLIDIPSPSVAQNVAEDLSTRMINVDFNLVERGQLDKALKELKIQDSGMIDQATAQKLGQITGCNFILVGSVSDRGQFIVMNARILETATGKAVAAESVECRKIEI